MPSAWPAGGPPVREAIEAQLRGAALDTASWRGIASFRQLVEAEGREGMLDTASRSVIARSPLSAEVIVRPDAPRGSAARYFERVAALQGPSPAAAAIAAISQTWHTVTALEGGEPRATVSMSPADYAELQEELLRQASMASIRAAGIPAGLMSDGPPRDPYGLRVAYPGSPAVAAGVDHGRGEDRGATRWAAARSVSKEDRMLEGTVE